MEKEIKNKTRVGITCGDPAGIGPELIVKLASDNRILQEAILIVYCPLPLIQAAKKSSGLEDLPSQHITNLAQAQLGKLNVFSPKDPAEIVVGKPDNNSASIALWALEKSSDDLENGAIEAVVTAPLSKQHMAVISPGFSGHTEYYDKRFKKEGALMVLCSDRLKVALATNHLPIKDISSAITKDTLLAAIRNLSSMLQQDFGVVRPKIAVLGLNPHAGESGNIGTEEMEQISPAISAAKSANILAFGPYAADGFFGSGQCFQFDAVLAMFHDQGLTGFKAIAFDGGVNYTAGLTIVRTSPGHGTAFDLAGKGHASEEGLRNAVYMALDVHKHRKDYLENNANPLRFSAVQKDIDGPV